jgi:hypothetical protein
MASRYWVGGTATWDGTAGAKWSLTSGGTGNQAVPVSGDDVFFDANSGAVTVNTDATGNFINCKNLDFNGFTGTFAGTNDGFYLRIYGTVFRLGSGMTYSTTKTIELEATSGTVVITSNGKTCTASTINIGGSGNGATFQLADDFILSGLGGMPISGGTLDMNNHNLKVNSIQIFGTPTLTMGSGTLEITGTNCTLNGLTLNANTSTVKMTDSSNSRADFNPGSLTIYKVWFARGASTGDIVINRNLSGKTPSFTGFRDTGTVAHTIRFETDGGATYTFSDATQFLVSGSLGNLISINSDTSGNPSTNTHTLSCASGTVSCDYLDIQHSVAQGGATWSAGQHSINHQAVATAGSGWIFPSAGGSFLLNMI